MFLLLLFNAIVVEFVASAVFDVAANAIAVAFVIAIVNTVLIPLHLFLCVDNAVVIFAVTVAVVAAAAVVIVRRCSATTTANSSLLLLT